MGRETIRGVKYQKNKPTASNQRGGGNVGKRRRQSHGLPTANLKTQNRVENEHGLNGSGEIPTVQRAQKNNLFNLYNHPQRGLVKNYAASGR